MSRIAAIGLGGNVGNVTEHFAAALAHLNALDKVRVSRISRAYRTAAVGAAAGADFVNAVALLEVEWNPAQLLACLQSIELAAGRERSLKWGPRPLDLDLLAYADEVMHSNQLVVPHPGCWYRRFVLDPWHEVAADWRHPELGETVSELRRRLLRRPLRVSVSADDGDGLAEEVRNALRSAHAPEVVTVAADKNFETTYELAFRLVGETLPSQRVVSLADDPHPASLAVEIVKAALDEPVVVEGWPR